MLGVSEDQEVRLDWREHEKRAGERPNHRSGQDRILWEESLISVSCWEDHLAGGWEQYRKQEVTTIHVGAWIEWGRVVGGGQG